jgi:hypothetical protein
VPLDLQIVGPDPRAHLLAGVPGGIVPQQNQDAFLLGRQPLAEPGEKGGRDMTDRPAIDKPQQHSVVVSPQQPIATHGFGLSLPLGRDLLDQPQGLPCGPAVQRGVGHPTPPGLSSNPQHPIRMVGGQVHQPVARLFLNAYWASGLVIQCLARRQFTPNRLSAWRTVSMLTWSGVRPRSQQTSAAQGSVQVRRGLPKVRGRSCSSARNGWASSTRRGRLGRRDWACTLAKPRGWKACMGLRTLWAAQPNCRAICAGRCPRALASRIWHRRRVKASAERSPASRCWRSSGVKGRTYRAGFMPPPAARIRS